MSEESKKVSSLGDEAVDVSVFTNLLKIRSKVARSVSVIVDLGRSDDFALNVSGVWFWKGMSSKAWEAVEVLKS